MYVFDLGEMGMLAQTTSSFLSLLLLPKLERAVKRLVRAVSIWSRETSSLELETGEGRAKAKGRARREKREKRIVDWLAVVVVAE